MTNITFSSPLSSEKAQASCGAGCRQQRTSAAIQCSLHHVQLSVAPGMLLPESTQGVRWPSTPIPCIIDNGDETPQYVPAAGGAKGLQDIRKPLPHHRPAAGAGTVARTWQHAAGGADADALQPCAAGADELCLL